LNDLFDLIFISWIQGLISELSPEGRINDKIYLSNLIHDSRYISRNKGDFNPHRHRNQPTVILIPHLEFPPTSMFSTINWVSGYCEFIAKCAMEAATGLLEGGVFVVGVKDIRLLKNNSRYENGIFSPAQTELIPLPLIIQKDLTSRLPAFLKLKELIVMVPDGYSRDRNENPEDIKNWLDAEREIWVKEKELESDMNAINMKSNGYRNALPIVHVSLISINELFFLLFILSLFKTYKLNLNLII